MSALAHNFWDNAPAVSFLWSITTLRQARAVESTSDPNLKAGLFPRPKVDSTSQVSSRLLSFNHYQLVCDKMSLLPFSLQVPPRVTGFMRYSKHRTVSRDWAMKGADCVLFAPPKVFLLVVNIVLPLLSVITVDVVATGLRDTIF